MATVASHRGKPANVVTIALARGLATLVREVAAHLTATDIPSASRRCRDGAEHHPDLELAAGVVLNCGLAMVLGQPATLAAPHTRQRAPRESAVTRYQPSHMRLNSTRRPAPATRAAPRTPKRPAHNR